MFNALALVAAGLAVTAQAPATKVKLGDRPPVPRILEQEDLFTAGTDGYAVYRIPAVVATDDGTILAFCEGRKNDGSDSGDIDIVLRRSTDAGRTWSDMTVVVDDGVDTCGNPAPVIERTTGDVVLVFTKNKGDGPEPKILRGEAPPRTVWVTRSTDLGRTWSEPREISADVRKPDWRWYATGPGHGIQLRDGRIVIPCNHSLNEDTATWHSHVIYSDDRGETWALGGVQPEGHTNESTLVELADGRVYQNMRSYRGNHRRLWATSSDRGETFEPAREAKELVEPVCQASVVRYSLASEDGAGYNRILFSNPASENRERLSVRISYDEGETWPQGRMLHPGPAAYSDLVTVRTRGGRFIGCLYERGEETPYECVTFARFPLRWLEPVPGVRSKK
jgi:sialidase-1